MTPLKKLLTDYTILDPLSRSRFSDLYKIYQVECREAQQVPMPVKTFSQTLRQELLPEITKGSIQFKKQSGTVIWGLHIKNV